MIDGVNGCFDWATVEWVDHSPQICRFSCHRFASGRQQPMQRIQCSLKRGRWSSCDTDPGEVDIGRHRSIGDLLRLKFQWSLERNSTWTENNGLCTDSIRGHLLLRCHIWPIIWRFVQMSQLLITDNSSLLLTQVWEFGKVWHPRFGQIAPKIDQPFHQ